MAKSYLLQHVGSVPAATQALADELPGPKDPWLLRAIDGDVVATIYVGTELEGESNLHLRADVEGQSFHKIAMVVELFERIRRRVGGTVSSGSREHECHFHLEVFAPSGLEGIERHLDVCTLGLEPWRSGFNGQIILRSNGHDDRWDFEMDPSTSDYMHASGLIYLVEDEAWAAVSSLSSALKLAGFPHELLMDDSRGQFYRHIGHLMPLKDK